MLPPSIRAIAAGAALALSAACPALAQGASHTVEITAFRYTPETLRVRPGDTVVFVNKDIVPHTVTQTGAGGLESGTMPRNGSWSVRVATAGSIDYFCRHHPTMKGRLVVE